MDHFFLIITAGLGFLIPFFFYGVSRLIGSDTRDSQEIRPPLPKTNVRSFLAVQLSALLILFVVIFFPIVSAFQDIVAANEGETKLRAATLLIGFCLLVGIGILFINTKRDTEWIKTIRPPRQRK